MLDKYITAVSSQRFESYRSRTSDDIETFTKCLWNISVCESFYPSLQNLEIGLRNAIHNALTFSYRTSLWFKQSFLCEMCREDIENAEKDLKNKGKDHNDSGRIIAELKFGFWARLFNKHYQQTLWNNKTFLIRVFPNAEARQRIRTNLAVQIDSIRRFRNRVFHHERILGDKIEDIHNNIIEILGWINPILVDTNNLVDRFTVVYSEDHFNRLKGVIQENLKEK